MNECLLLKYVYLCMYCMQVKLGVTFHRTDVCPKTLNPVWDSQWFKFNVSHKLFVSRVDHIQSVLFFSVVCGSAFDWLKFSFLVACSSVFAVQFLITCSELQTASDQL